MFEGMRGYFFVDDDAAFGLPTTPVQFSLATGADHFQHVTDLIKNKKWCFDRCWLFKANTIHLYTSMGQPPLDGMRRCVVGPKTGSQDMPDHVIAVMWPQKKQSVYRTRYLKTKLNNSTKNKWKVNRRRIEQEAKQSNAIPCEADQDGTERWKLPVKRQKEIRKNIIRRKQ